MTLSRCIFPPIPRLCTLFRLACYISSEAAFFIVPVKKYRLLFIRFITCIFGRSIGTLMVRVYRCGPLPLIGANAPRFSNLHLEYVSLGARIAPSLPTVGIKKLSLSYHMHGFQEDVSQDS